MSEKSSKDFEFRIDDLQTDGLKLKQNPSFYCFNCDSVMLANLVKVMGKSKALELGAGSGVISVLLTGKRKLKHITAVEKQAEMFALLKENVSINNLSDKIEILNADISELEKYYSRESFDLVVCNPPYEKATGRNSVTDNCRSENLATVGDFIAAASKMLMFGKDFYMVCKMRRLQEVMALLSKHNLAVKELIIVYPKADKEADTFIVRAVKGGKEELRSDYIVQYNGDGTMTRKFEGLYK